MLRRGKILWDFPPGPAHYPSVKTSTKARRRKRSPGDQNYGGPDEHGQDMIGLGGLNPATIYLPDICLAPVPQCRVADVELASFLAFLKPRM